MLRRFAPRHLHERPHRPHERAVRARWDRAFIAQYPSYTAFVEMLRDPIYREAVKHRQAAVEDSRLTRFDPARPGETFGEVVASKS